MLRITVVIRNYHYSAAPARSAGKFFFTFTNANQQNGSLRFCMQKFFLAFLHGGGRSPLPAPLNPPLLANHKRELIFFVAPFFIGHGLTVGLPNVFLEQSSINDNSTTNLSLSCSISGLIPTSSTYQVGGMQPAFCMIIFSF